VGAGAGWEREQVRAHEHDVGVERSQV
jgi:hypothetical protein